MKLLFVEAKPGTATSVKDQLTAAGHQLVSCYDDETNGPCRSVASSAGCPLHSHIDLTVVARSAGEADTLFEMGGVCSELHRVPVVRVDPAGGDDVAGQVVAAAAAGRDRTEAAYAAAVRTALAPRDVTVEAARYEGRVHVTVRLPVACDAHARSAVADRARAAIRDFDPFVSTIDISVIGAEVLT